MFRSLTLLLIYVIVLGAIFTPPIYALLQSLPALADDMWPYSRVYDRVVLLIVIVLIVLMRKRFDLSIFSGIFKKSRFKFYLKEFSIGLLLTLAPVLVVLFCCVNGQYLTWKSEEFSYYVYKFSKLIPTILVVGILEELIFRVFIFIQLRVKYSFYLAALLCSIFYAAVHFIVPDKSFAFVSGDYLFGFKYYLAVVEQIFGANIWVQFFILFLIGLFLCWVFEKTKSLFLCVGLHAGWIAAIKIAKYCTEIVPGANTVSKVAQRYYLLEVPYTWIAIVVSLILFVILYFTYLSKRVVKSD